MNQTDRISRHGVGALRQLSTIPGFALVAAIISWISVTLGDDHFMTVLALSLLAVAAGTIMLPVQVQLLLFWTWLPFIDLLKRLVFLQPGSQSSQYLMLLGPDLILLTILLKLLLSALQAPVRIHWTRVDLAVTLFAAYSLLSALLTPGVPFSARAASIAMRVWPMVAYYLAAAYWSRPVALARIVRITWALTLIVALYGIRQFFFGLLPFERAWLLQSTSSSNAAHLLYDASRGVFRTFGTMDSHSSYGIFVGTGLVLGWAHRHRLGLFLWVLSSAILTLGLIVSFTRFTWLMPPLAFCFVFLFSYRKIKPLFDFRHLRRATLLLVAIVGSFLVFYLLMDELYGRALIRTSDPYLQRVLGTGTLEARLQIRDAIESGYTFSLLGNGLARSGYFARKFGFESNSLSSHNIFIDMVDSTGLVGLALFLAFLYLFIQKALRVIDSQANRPSRRMLVALFAVILAMITVGHFNGAVFYFGHALPFYFWALCGILAHFRSDGSTERLRTADETR